MTDEQPSAIPAGTLLAGKLRIVRLIGEGGMGAVYEVEHEFTKHRRAMKMLHAEMAAIPGVVARFLREASAAGRIGNPHIIETFDAGKLESGEPYLVMEMLSGRPLDEVIEARGYLDYATAVSVLQQACDGVHAAHGAGIVHRDLKPENLFLVGEGAPFVKILDFGISKFDPTQTGDNQLTQEGTALGTPFYMPPEQVRGISDLDRRADVYSLGVVLYECVTGRKPFYAESLPHIAVLIHEGRFDPITIYRPDAPNGLQDVIAKAMATDREQRFETAAELSRALADIDLSTPAATAQTIVATAVDGTPRAVVGATPPSAGARNALVTSATRAGEAPKVQAITEGAVSVEQTPGGRSGPSKLGFAVAALLLAAGAAAFWALAPDGDGQAGTTAEPAAPSPSAAVTTPSPSIAPILPPEGDDPAPTATPSAAPSPKPPVRVITARPTSTSPPTPTREAPDEKPGTRATQHGLAEENPF